MAYFNKFVTEEVVIKSNDERIFTGHITAEIVDKQNEYIAVSELMKVMDVFMTGIPVISDSHTNRMVGQVLSYEKSEINGHASVKITGQVRKHDKVSLYDKVWESVKSGVYKGLSIGGGAKKREPIYKNGRAVVNLRDLEIYEIALCEDPANPLALVDHVNEFAKDGNMTIKDYDGRKVIQCESVFCKSSEEPSAGEEPASDWSYWKAQISHDI